MLDLRTFICGGFPVWLFFIWGLCFLSICLFCWHILNQNLNWKKTKTLCGRHNREVKIYLTGKCKPECTIKKNRPFFSLVVWLYDISFDILIFWRKLENNSFSIGWDIFIWLLSSLASSVCMIISKWFEFWNADNEPVLSVPFTAFCKCGNVFLIKRGSAPNHKTK